MSRMDESNRRAGSSTVSPTPEQKPAPLGTAGLVVIMSVAIFVTIAILWYGKRFLPAGNYPVILFVPVAFVGFVCGVGVAKALGLWKSDR